MSLKSDIAKRLLKKLEIDLDDDSIAALKAKLENPTAGRLVYLPYQAGGKVIPKMQEDKGGDTHGKSRSPKA